MTCALETVWKLKTSSLLGSHECSKRDPEALIRRLGGHQIHTLLSLLAIFQTVTPRRAYPIPHSKRTSGLPPPRIARKRSSRVFVVWELHRDTSTGPRARIPLPTEGSGGSHEAPPQAHKEKHHTGRILQKVHRAH